MQELGDMLKRNHKSVLLYDGIHILARSMERLFEQTDLKTPNVNCSDREEHFSLGRSIFDELHKVFTNMPSFHEFFNLTHQPKQALLHVFTGGNAWVEWTHSFHEWYASGSPLSNS